MLNQAFGGALSLLLVILVLRLALPEVAELLIQIINQILAIISGMIDLISIPQ